MKDSKKTRLTAALLTVGIVALVTVTLNVMSVSARDAFDTWPPQSEQEIFFEDIELPEPEMTRFKPSVQVDNNPASSAASDTGGLDLDDFGAAEGEPDMLATTEPQPENHQVTKPEQPTPPAGNDEARREEEERKARLKRLPGQNSFAEDVSEEEATDGKSSEGNTSHGANVNTDGLGVRGRSVKARPGSKYRSNTDDKGYATVEIEIHADGTVHNPKVTFVSSTIANKTAFSDFCIKVCTNELKYSADPTRPTQKATITIHLQ